MGGGEPRWPPWGAGALGPIPAALTPEPHAHRRYRDSLDHSLAGLELGLDSPTAQKMRDAVTVGCRPAWTVWPGVSPLEWARGRAQACLGCCGLASSQHVARYAPTSRRDRDSVDLMGTEGAAAESPLSPFKEARARVQERRSQLEAQAKAPKDERWRGVLILLAGEIEDE